MGKYIGSDNDWERERGRGERDGTEDWSALARREALAERAAEEAEAALRRSGARFKRDGLL